MPRLMLLAVLVGAALVAAMPLDMAPRVDYHRHKVFRMLPSSRDQLELIGSLGEQFKLDFWTSRRAVAHPIDARVPVESQAAVVEALNAHAVEWSVMIDDVQKAADEQRKGHGAPSAQWNYTSYHTYEEIMDWVQGLPAKYGDLVTLVNITASYEGRSIIAVKINSKASADAPGLWMDGGIHAREWISPATVIWMLGHMLDNYGKDAAVTKLVDSARWTILPLFNVDGYAYTWSNDRMWRKTRSHYPGHLCVGTDPNRNWDDHWGEAGSSGNPCSDSYEGPKAFSEVEVRAVGEYICAQKSTPNAYNGYINFHSYSQLVMSPYGWTSQLPPDSKQQLAAAKAMVDAIAKPYGTKYEYGPIATTIYPASGSSADYTYDKCGVKYSYGVELRDTGRYGFLLPADQIEPSGIETFDGIQAWADFIVANP